MKIILLIYILIFSSCNSTSEVKISADINQKTEQTPSTDSNSDTSSNDNTSSNNTTDNTSSTTENSNPSYTAMLSISDFTDPDANDANFHNMVAYSVRRVVQEYSGPFFRAIRSDGVEADFGAGVDNIDTVALQNWMNEGNGSASIVTWYDQSGNNEHAHQSDANLRPDLIADCSTGADPYPCLNLNQDALYFNDSSSTYGVRMNNLSGMAMFIVLKYNTTGNQMILGDNSTNYEVLHYGSTVYAYSNTASLTQNTSNFSSISILEDTANTGYFYSNGSFISSSSNMWNASSPADTSNFGTLGLFFDFSGKIVNYQISELILINSAISREDTQENKQAEITTNISNFYGI